MKQTILNFLWVCKIWVLFKEFSRPQADTDNFHHRLIVYNFTFYNCLQYLYTFLPCFSVNVWGSSQCSQLFKQVFFLEKVLSILKFISFLPAVGNTMPGALPDNVNVYYTV